MGIGTRRASLFDNIYDIVLYCCAKCVRYNHHGGILGKHKVKIIQKNDIGERTKIERSSILKFNKLICRGIGKLGNRI